MEKTYRTEDYEFSSDVSDFEEYEADLLMVKINNKPALMLHPNVLPTQPLPVEPECDEKVLENTITKASDRLPDVVL